MAQAMREPIVFPDIDAPQPRLSLWFVKIGETVQAGDRLLEILVDEAVVEAPAPAAGRLVEIAAWPGEPLEPGQVLGYLELSRE